MMNRTFLYDKWNGDIYDNDHMNDIKLKKMTMKGWHDIEGKWNGKIDKHEIW